MNEDQAEPTLADIFNIPRTAAIEFEGKSYVLRHPTEIEQGTFSVWLEANAVAFVARQKHIPEAERKLYRREIKDDAAAGAYEYGGLIATKALGQIEAVAKLNSIMLQNDGHDECDPAFCKRMILKQAERDALLLLENPDPKVARAMEAILALILPKNPTPTSAPPTSPTSGGASPAC